MPTVSLCMIVKNEEETLAGCLDSVRGLVDEIVIVDTGSTDATKAVAGKYTRKILDFAWIDDFSAARNCSFAHATKDYILWLDADDRLLPQDRERFKNLKKALSPSVDTVMMRYNTGFDAAGNVTFSYFRERMVKRSRHFQWKEPVHEYLETGGEIVNADVCVTHAKVRQGAPGRNIAIYEKLLTQGGALTPRGLYYYARELKENGRTQEAAERFLRFLDSGEGWVEDNIVACLELSECFAQESLQQRQLAALTRSFAYDIPRAEACCRIGYLYKSREDFERAAFWFELAASLKKPDENWGFMEEDCWGYIPCIELAVCYDRLGDLGRAERYNTMAGAFKPGDPAVEFNRRYFQEKRMTKSPRADTPAGRG